MQKDTDLRGVFVQWQGMQQQYAVQALFFSLVHALCNEFCGCWLLKCLFFTLVLLNQN